MIPSNFVFLNNQQQQLRGLAIEALEASPDHLLHLQMVERSLDLLNILVEKAPAANEDQITVQLLGVRVSNDLMGCLQLCLAGLCQSGVMLLRDAFETTLLVDYLHHAPSRIVVWRDFTAKNEQVASTENRRKVAEEFRAISIREALDSRDGDATLRRQKRYKMLCNLGAHPTSVGAALTRGDDCLPRWGPFFRKDLIFATIEELTWVAMEGALVLGHHFDLQSSPHIAVDIGFYETMSLWNEHFFGVPHQADRFAELRDLVAQVHG
jgi:hypothetical protein